MSNVNDYLKKMADEVASKKKRARGTEKRLTVVLSEYDARRLKYISKMLGETSSAFARNLIVQALDDAEKVLYLREYEDEPMGLDADGDPIYSRSEYGMYVNHVSSDDDDDSDD